MALVLRGQGIVRSDTDLAQVRAGFRRPHLPRPTRAPVWGPVAIRAGRAYLRGMANPRAPRRLGATGPEVFPLALGCMGMSGMYGPSDEAESVATIHAALDAGVTLLDTGDFYGSGHNEMLIGRAIRDRGQKPLLSVKFGAMRGPDGSWIGIDGRPAAVKNSLA